MLEVLYIGLFFFSFFFAGMLSASVAKRDLGCGWPRSWWIWNSGLGGLTKKREELHKRAEMNRAFAHFCDEVVNLIDKLFL